MDTPVYSVEDYVRLEEYSNTKHEFIDGQIWAMSGGTLEHSRLAASIILQLGNQLSGRDCDVYTSDARVRVVPGALITYPDVIVSCGQAQTDTEDRFAMVNPVVLVEVTSASSEKYDRGTKFQRYKLIPSLREYVIVSHRAPTIEVFRADDNGTWTGGVCAGPGQRALLLSIHCEIDVDAVSRRRLGS